MDGDNGDADIGGNGSGNSGFIQVFPTHRKPGVHVVSQISPSLGSNRASGPCVGVRIVGGVATFGGNLGWELEGQLAPVQSTGWLGGGRN
jgi:hypothetical protein